MDAFRRCCRNRRQHRLVHLSKDFGVVELIHLLDFQASVFVGSDVEIHHRFPDYVLSECVLHLGGGLWVGIMYVRNECNWSANVNYELPRSVCERMDGNLQRRFSWV